VRFSLTFPPAASGVCCLWPAICLRTGNSISMNETNSAPAPASAPTERTDVRRLRDLSPQQWKSGIAAWLGWLFDGLAMHIYTLMATAFVAIPDKQLTAPEPVD